MTQVDQKRKWATALSENKKNQGLVKAMSWLVTSLMGSWTGLRASEEYHEQQKTETLSSGSEDFEQTLLTSLHNQ